MPNVRPRPLEARDIAAVARIEAATFTDAWSAQSFRESLDRDEVRAIAIDDEAGTLVGYALAVNAGDEGEILNIAVAERVRGQGYGHAMMADLLEHLENAGVRKVFLEVRRSNEAAIRLYRAFGFSDLGVRPAYYGRPREDALTMALHLGSGTARKG